ncbi:hypothetical protein LCER1_G000264 [Lachnellula cervina]|uniref:CENP-V/GFA domain-containing protein n=1 Tax=Lachnellula cervina TaxID=1316786 RepID=A0A7D8UVK8_9HELO|nr:hypothetical protein LCER1_G000264 [Lachnellula cervina]
MAPSLNPSFSNAAPLDFAHITLVEETPASEHTSYTGACHCGAVKFNVTLKCPFPKYPVNACSCSACIRNGYLFVYPKRGDFEITQGSENLTSYTFNTCTRILEQGETDPRKDILALNVRNFKDIDLDALQYTYFDGKKLIPSKE